MDGTNKVVCECNTCYKWEDTTEIYSAKLMAINEYSEPVYYGHLGTSQKCPDYQGFLIFQVSLHDNVSFGTIARCVDYAGDHIFKCPD